MSLFQNKRRDVKNSNKIKQTALSSLKICKKNFVPFFSHLLVIKLEFENFKIEFRTRGEMYGVDIVMFKAIFLVTDAI